MSTTSDTVKALAQYEQGPFLVGMIEKISFTVYTIGYAIHYFFKDVGTWLLQGVSITRGTFILLVTMFVLNGVRSILEIVLLLF